MVGKVLVISEGGLLFCWQILQVKPSWERSHIPYQSAPFESMIFQTSRSVRCVSSLQGTNKNSTEIISFYFVRWLPRLKVWFLSLSGLWFGQMARLKPGQRWSFHFREQQPMSPNEPTNALRNTDLPASQMPFQSCHGRIWVDLAVTCHQAGIIESFAPKKCA